MSAVSVRELNSSVSKVIARVQAGECVEVTKDGKVVAEIRPRREDWFADPARRAARDRLIQLMNKGVHALERPLSYEERTES